MAWLLPRLRAWREDARGVAATEFAMATPVVMLLMLGGFDVGRFALATQRVELVANEVGEIVAQTVYASSNASGQTIGTINDTQLGNAQQAAMFIFPQALAAASQQGVFWTSLLKVDVTSLQFVTTPAGCTSSCNYVPKVIWSTGARPCSTTFTQAANTSTPSPTTLPAALYSPVSQIVVDVTYTFQPTFGAQYFGGATIARSYYVSPRNVNFVEMSSGSTLAQNCSGAP